MKSANVGGMRAAIYARVSEDGLTLDEELCFLDDGYSGSSCWKS